MNKLIKQIENGNYKYEYFNLFVSLTDDFKKESVEELTRMADACEMTTAEYVRVILIKHLKDNFEWYKKFEKESEVY